MPFESVRQFSGQLMGQAPGLRAAGGQLQLSVVQQMRERYNKLVEILAKRKRAKDLRKQMKAQESNAPAIGAGVGGAVALGLAPFTGGASLALLPALTAGGAGVGQLIEGQTQQGLSNISSGVASGRRNVGMIDWSVFFGKSSNAASFMPTRRFEAAQNQIKLQ